MSVPEDTFARDHLPSPEQLPDFINLEKLNYPARLNCAVELLDKAVAAGDGDRICIRTPVETLTYIDFQHRVNRIAQVLQQDLHMKSGERVLLRAPNNAMMAACWFAVIKAGGIAVASMPLLRARELSAIVEKARIRLALCDERLVAELETAQEASRYLEEILVFGAGQTQLERLMCSKETGFDACDTASDDICLIAFTSGTTGTPKGTMHFHRDVMAICDTFSKQVLRPAPDDIFAGSPPLAFTFGLGGLLLFPMHAGASTLLLENAAPEKLAAAIGEYGITTLFTAPTAYRVLLNSPFDFSSLRQCVSAGETLPLPTAQTWFEKTGIRIIDALGTTEMLHVFISAAGDDICPGATGKAIAYFEAKIVDEKGADAPANTVGRLAVRGPTGCRYLADERQKEYVMNGWNFTGDSYLMDDAGYFWFQARADDMIISAGYNIAGPEVEEALLAHDAVAECAVVASPDPDRGNIVKAFVVLRPGVRPKAELMKELQDFAKQQIAPYKYPRAIEFMQVLPRTGTGKIQRFRLRELEQQKQTTGRD